MGSSFVLLISCEKLSVPQAVIASPRLVESEPNTETSASVTDHGTLVLNFTVFG